MMKNSNQNLKEIEKLLEGVYFDLYSLTETNFSENFESAKVKMREAKSIASQKSSKFQNFETNSKIRHLAKLISENYDNIVKVWAERLKMVQKEIELNQNQKKITLYSR